MSHSYQTPPGGWLILAYDSFTMVEVAAVIMVLFAAGPTMGGRSAWSAVGETPVLEQMRTFRFDAMGTSRSYLEFYLGRVVISVLQFMQAVPLWQVGGPGGADARRARPDRHLPRRGDRVNDRHLALHLSRAEAIFSVVYTLGRAGASPQRA